jgi:hypothetical protein
MDRVFRLYWTACARRGCRRNERLRDGAVHAPYTTLGTLSITCAMAFTVTSP